MSWTSADGPSIPQESCRVCGWVAPFQDPGCLCKRASAEAVSFVIRVRGLFQRELQLTQEDLAVLYDQTRRLSPLRCKPTSFTIDELRAIVRVKDEEIERLRQRVSDLMRNKP